MKKYLRDIHLSQFWCATFLCIAIILASVSSLSAETVVSAKTDKPSYRVGDTVVVDIVLSGNPSAGLHGIYFDLVFDPAVFTFEQIKKGGVVSSEARSSAFLYALANQTTTTRLGGRVAFSYALDGKNQAFNTNGTIAQAVFRVSDTPVVTSALPIFAFAANGASDGDEAATPVAGIVWRNSPALTVTAKANSAYLVISEPKQNALTYKDSINLKAVYAAGAANTLVVSNPESGYSSTALSGASGVINGHSVPVIYGMNRITATLFNPSAQKIASDTVLVYRSDTNKYVKILSPEDHELLGTDMVTVRVSAPEGYGVVVNGLNTSNSGDKDGTNAILRASVWLRPGFNTISAVATNAENAKYTQTIQVYYRKDSAIFGFVTPLDNQYFKPGADQKLTIVGEIDSPWQSAPAEIGGAPKPNTVTLRAIFRPKDVGQRSIVLVDNKQLTIAESAFQSGQRSRYSFANTGFEILLTNLSQGEIELVAYKNLVGTKSDAEIHRIVQVDGNRLWIDLFQPGVMGWDSLDSYERILAFFDGTPAEEAALAPFVDPTGSISLPAAVKNSQTETFLAPGNVVKNLVDAVDIAELSDGTLYSLTSKGGTTSILKKTLGSEKWTTIQTLYNTYGYKLYASNEGLFVGVSNVGNAEDSGLYLLKNDALKNVRFTNFPLALKNVQFIEVRGGAVYLYGNYYSSLYSFKLEDMVESAGLFTVTQTESQEFENNLSIASFSLAPDANSAILRTTEGNILLARKTGSRYALRSVQIDQLGTTIDSSISGYYEAGVYNAYLLLKKGSDTRAWVLMDRKDGQSNPIVTPIDIRAILGIAAQETVSVLGANFANDEFRFLYKNPLLPGSEALLSSGKLFFSSPSGFDPGSRSSYPLVIPAGAPLFLSLFQTQSSVFFANFGLQNTGDGDSNQLASYYRSYSTDAQNIDFTYSNPDIEAIQGFEFSIDPLWFETSGFSSFGFSLYKQGIVPRATLFDLPLTDLASIEDSANSSNRPYVVSISTDEITGKKIVHVEFKEIQPSSAVHFSFLLKSPGFSSPSIGDIRIYKKIRPKIAIANRGDPAVLPIAGFVYDRTVTEISINGNRIELARDGSFHFNLSIDTNLLSIPVELSCTNATGEKAIVKFVADILLSRNKFVELFSNTAPSLREPVEAINNSASETPETLFMSGSAWGLAGAVVGYEVFTFKATESGTVPVMLRQGLFDSVATILEEDDFDFGPMGFPESGYVKITWGALPDNWNKVAIPLIPGNQELRVFVENPGGKREYYKVGDLYPQVNYSLSAGNQAILFEQKMEPAQTLVGSPLLVSGAYQLTATESGTEPSGPFAFTGVGEINGSVKTINPLTELIVKSYTPGLLFAGGKTEIRVPVAAGNTFRVAFTYTMGAEITKKFYIGVIPTIPALTSLGKAAEITITKSFKNSCIIPAFETLHPGPWRFGATDNQNPLLLFGLNRSDFPVDDPSGMFIFNWHLNYGSNQSGKIVPLPGSPGIYGVADENGKLLTLNSIKTGKNRLSWAIQYSKIGDTVLVSSSESGRNFMNDFLFEVPEQTGLLPTSIGFSSPMSATVYYDAATLPKLQVVKDPATNLTVSLNGTVVWQPGNPASLSNFTFTNMNEGLNNLDISYSEGRAGAVETRLYSFLYDSKQPNVVISSTQYESGQPWLQSVQAVVTEANLRDVYLFLGDNNISVAPTSTVLKKDSVMLRWDNIQSFALVPSLAAPIRVRVTDQKERTGEAQFTGILSNLPASEIPAVSAQASLIPYAGVPALANEQNYAANPFPTHTKIAPLNYPQSWSIKDRLNSNYLIDGPLTNSGQSFQSQIDFPHSYTQAQIYTASGSNFFVVLRYVPYAGISGITYQPWLEFYARDDRGTWSYATSRPVPVTGKALQMGLAAYGDKVLVSCRQELTSSITELTVFLFRFDSSNSSVQSVTAPRSLITPSGYPNYWGYRIPTALNATTAIVVADTHTVPTDQKSRQTIFLMDQSNLNLNGQLLEEHTLPNAGQSIDVSSPRDSSVNFALTTINSTNSIYSVRSYYYQSVSYNKVFVYQGSWKPGANLSPNALVFINDNGTVSVRHNITGAVVGTINGPTGFKADGIKTTTDRVVVKWANVADPSMQRVIVYSPAANDTYIQIDQIDKPASVVSQLEDVHVSSFGIVISDLNGTYGSGSGPQVVRSAHRVYNRSALIANFPKSPRFVVLKITKDNLVVSDKTSLREKITLEEIGFKKSPIPLTTIHIPLTTTYTDVAYMSNVGSAKLVVESPTHIFLAYDIADINAWRANYIAGTPAQYAPGYIPGSGLRVNIAPGVKIADIYAAGAQMQVEAGNVNFDINALTFHDAAYETTNPSDPIRRQLRSELAAAIAPPSKRTLLNAQNAIEKTWSFWFRLEDVRNDIGTPKKLATIVTNSNIELANINYKYLQIDAANIKPVINFYKVEANSTSTALMPVGIQIPEYVEGSGLPEGWHFITVHVSNRNPLTPEIKFRIDNMAVAVPISLEDYPSFAAQMLAADSGLRAGPRDFDSTQNYGPNNTLTTGFFSISDLRFIDKELSDAEYARLINMRDTNVAAGTRRYDFNNYSTGTQPTDIRAVAPISNPNAPYQLDSKENAVYSDPAQGSLVASAGRKNLFAVVPVGSNVLVRFAGSNNSHVLYNMSLIAEPSAFQLVPSDASGNSTYYFGNQIGNYGLKAAGFYTLSGTVLDVESGKAFVVLKINGVEKQYPLSTGPFSYTFANPGNAAPLSVSCFVRSASSIRLADDLSLNEGDYRIPGGISFGQTATKTYYPFGLSGTISFWYKPFNTNAEGLTNEPTTLFHNVDRVGNADVEAFKISVRKDGAGVGTYAWKVFGKHSELKLTGEPVIAGWNFVQLSYDTQKGAYLRVNGRLIDAAEGSFLPSPSMLGGALISTDNVYIGANQSGTEFAEAYIDDVVFESYLKDDFFVSNKPLNVAYSDAQKLISISPLSPITLAMVTNGQHIVEDLSGSRYQHGPIIGNQISVEGIPAGSYRAIIRATVNGLNYSSLVYFQINDVPRFLLRDRSPIVFAGSARSIEMDFLYDSTWARQSNTATYAGVALKYEYTDTTGADQERYAYLAQDFINQDQGLWKVGEKIGTASIAWQDLAPRSDGLLPIICNGINTDSSVVVSYKPFYLFSPNSEYVFDYESLPAADSVRVQVDIAELDIQLESRSVSVGDETKQFEYAQLVTVGGGAVINSVFQNMSVEVVPIIPVVGFMTPRLFKLNSAGIARIYYDDLLPGFGTYNLRFNLKYNNAVYDSEVVTAVWSQIVSSQTSTAQAAFDLFDLSLLQLDKTKNKASFSFQYLASGVGTPSGKLEIIQNGVIVGSAFTEFDFDTDGNINRGFVFDKSVPIGSSTARLTLAATDATGNSTFTRVREVQLSNASSIPSVDFTNKVDSLIAYNDVFLSWRGTYEDQYRSDIKYSYNFDNSGWTTPNSEWRSVRYYSLKEGYHNFSVKALYNGQTSAERSLTFFVDVKKPQIDPSAAKIKVEKIYDSNVFYAVNIIGEPGSVVDASLQSISVAGQPAIRTAGGGFAAYGIPITSDGINKVVVSAYDRVGNFTDHTISIDNTLTAVSYPARHVRYMPMTVVGDLLTSSQNDVSLYVSDSATAANTSGDFSKWKKARINEDRTFFIDDVLVNPGTDDREITTNLVLATVFRPGTANPRVFTKNIEVRANQMFMPIELTLSAHAMAGETVASRVTISARADIAGVSSWSIDFNGDGVYDLIDPVGNPFGPDSQSKTWEHSYSSLGLVQPRVRAITTDGQFFSVTDTLIIHERILEASNKMVETPLAMDTLGLPDGTRKIFVLRQSAETSLVETYEVARDDSYLSNVTSRINLDALGIKDAVRLKVIDASRIVVATSALGAGKIYLLKANSFGNFLVASTRVILGNIADLTVDTQYVYVTLRTSGDNTVVARVKFNTPDTLDTNVLTSAVEIPGAMPIGLNSGIERDDRGLLVADFFNQRIIRLGLNLNPLNLFGTFGNGEGEFQKPSIVRAFENRIFVYDEARRDIQVFDSAFNPICRIGYDTALGSNNYVEPNFLNEVADIKILTKVEGQTLYYYALILSKTTNKLALLRLPQWEELRARVRNNKIVFMKDKEVYTAKPDGSDLGKLLASDGLPPIEGMLNYPALSPDGRRLVFVSRLQLFNASGNPSTAPDGQPSYSYLYTKDLESGQLALVTLAGLEGYRMERPVFNSNGDKIIFSARKDSTKWQIYTYEFETRIVSRLFVSQENARFPYYSPDDRFVVFSTDYDGDEEIEIIDTLNTSQRITVTNNQSRDSLPVWSTVYPFEVSNQDLKVESKIAFVSERNFHKGVYFSYLTRNSASDLRVFDLKKKQDVGNTPDIAALEATKPGIEGDYPCFTGDGKTLLFEYFDGSTQKLKSFNFETNLPILLGTSGTTQLANLNVIEGAQRPAGMKNMISGFSAKNVNGDEIQLKWNRYTTGDVFYHVYFRKNKEGEPFVDKKVSSQSGTLLQGLDMGQEYLIRTCIVENGEEVATSQWKKVLMPDVVAKPTVEIDSVNPYIVRMHAWKPLPETKWKFSWLLDNQEIAVQSSQDFQFEYATSGTKTISLKAATLGDTSNNISSPITVTLRSDIEPVIEYKLSDDSSYIELNALNSRGAKIDWAATTWIISGPGRDQIQQLGAQPIVQLNGFQRKINVSLQLKRLGVNGQVSTDTLQKSITIDLTPQEVKPVVVYQLDDIDKRLVKFSGEYSKGNIDWFRASWTVFADSGVIYNKEGVSTFNYRFPETNSDTTYSISLTLPRKNDGLTETVNQVVTLKATPIEAVINYTVVDLKQGQNIIGQKLVLDATASKGSEIDFAQARWAVPIAGSYGESASQFGPTAVYNLVGISEDTTIQLTLTLQRKGGTDPITFTKVIKIKKGQLADNKLYVNQNLETSSKGKIVTLDILKSTGPSIEWDKTEWVIDGQTSRGPVAKYVVPTSSEKPIVRYSVTLYRSGTGVVPLVEHGEVMGLSETLIRPMIDVLRLDKISGETAAELSVLKTEGVNIDWERTTWSFYDGDQVVQKRGASTVHNFKPKSTGMDYPVMVEMYLKDGSKPAYGYKSINIVEDVFVPIISPEPSQDNPNAIVFSAVDSTGSGIQWSSAKWTFGDNSQSQYGQTGTNIYAADKMNKSYTVTLTLTRGTGNLAETKTVSKIVKIGQDKIKAKISASLMGDTLILSAADSEGTGLMLDRSFWLFDGKGDSSSSSDQIKTGKAVTKSFGANYSVQAEVGLQISTPEFFKVTGLSAWAKVVASGGIGGSYNEVDYTDPNNTVKDVTSTFSSSNEQTGVLCRRSLEAGQRYVLVTLAVYRSTKDGKIEGESLQQVIDLNEARSGITYPIE